MTVNSTSPRAALIRVMNFSQTPSRTLSLLFSARASRKFLTVLPLSWTPIFFWSSWTIWDLSETLRVGALRICWSLASFLKTADRFSRAFAVLSRVCVLTAAVYCRFAQ